MSGFNPPEDEPLVRYVNVQLSPITHARFNEKREKLGLTWTQFLRDAAEELYFG